MGVKSAVCLVVLLAIVLESSGQRNNRNNNRNNRNNRNRNNRNNNNNDNDSKKGENKKQPALLSPPVPEKCTSRPKHFQRDGHNYFFSKFEEGFEEMKGDWLEGRNFCREYCMDLVSLETQEENDFFIDYLERNDLDYIWTSGRLCDFPGCDRPDLQPVSVNGWFWTGSNKKIAPTNSTPATWDYQPWSPTGHLEIPQPDNAEEDINGSKESCLGLLNNIYSDGIKWHDIACYHPKPFMCEDSDALLDYVAATNEGIEL